MERIDSIGSFGSGGRLPDKGAELKEATTAFEAIFVRQMISAMRQTVGEGSVLPKSNAQKMFEGMLDEEWAKGLAGRDNGLGQILFEQIKSRMGGEAPSRANGEGA